MIIVIGQDCASRLLGGAPVRYSAPEIEEVFAVTTWLVEDVMFNQQCDPPHLLPISGAQTGPMNCFLLAGGDLSARRKKFKIKYADQACKDQSK